MKNNNNTISAIKNLENWASENCLNEDEIRRAVRQLLPSFRTTVDTMYGLYNNNGWHHCYFEVYNTRTHERYTVSFDEYDSYHDSSCSYSC